VLSFTNFKDKSGKFLKSVSRDSNHAPFGGGLSP